MASGSSGSLTAQGSTVISAPSRQASSEVLLRSAPQRSLEAIVRDYYSDTPILAEIARCESRFRHYDRAGKALQGEVDANDTGIMQVNERYHLKRAEKLGFDIYTLEGNLAYAKYLYLEEGSDPWRSSSACWGNYRETAKSVYVPKTSAFAKLSVPLVETN